LGLVVLLAVSGTSAPAQDKPDNAKAAGAFDDDKKAGEPQGVATAKERAVTDRDSIGFTQQNVASQMTELEERMFRLSEALRSLEPENASRLRLALKFSREELILQQMKETQKLMGEAQLNKAETEVRELLAKLEHLRRLLLAEDLDFQMKLARLRQMRETLGQLERIIKEERRELAWSRSATDAQDELVQSRAKRTELEQLVNDHEKVVRDTHAAIARDGSTARQESLHAIGTREAESRKKAAALSADRLFAELRPRFLKEADPLLGDSVTFLAAADARAAASTEDRALELLRKELDRFVGRIAKSQQAVAQSEFHRFEQDQARNRTAADSLAVASSRLGDSGVALQKDLIRAGASMHLAEQDLARIAAKPAAIDQLDALKHLVKSRDELARALESLLVELRTELQTRILAELTEMHEMQLAIRETTEAQAPRVKERSRTALVLVVGLSQKEAELAERTEHLRTLAEETEFGIALPTALRLLSVEMHKIQEWLKEGDASARTVTLEKRVEEDLLALAEAMRRLPPSTALPPGSPLPSDSRARERELNRLIAELKMLRLLQTRLNDDTLELDRGRPKTSVLTPALKREIESLRGAQEEIRESLKRVGAPLEPGAEPGSAPIDR
jgi:hypothetical protein